MATNTIIEKVNSTDGGVNRVASTFYCTCSTAADTAQKDATPADSCVFNDNYLITGVTVFVKFTYTNTHATPTLKVGTATAKQIMAYGTTKIGTSTTKSWYAGSVVSFTYDGTYWIQNDYKFDTDNNDVTTLRSYYTRFKAAYGGIRSYGLFAKLRDSDTYSSFTTTSGKGNKTYNTTNAFDLSKIYYYNSSADVAEGSYTGNNTTTNAVSLIDMRYTLNGVTTSATSVLVAQKPVYLLFNYNYKLTWPYFSQDIYNVWESDADFAPSYAVLLGIMHDSYRMDLLDVNPIFEVADWEHRTSQYGEEEFHPIFKPVYTINKVLQKIDDTTWNMYPIIFSKISSENEGYVYKSSKLTFNPQVNQLNTTGSIKASNKIQSLTSIEGQSGKFSSEVTSNFYGLTDPDSTDTAELFALNQTPGEGLYISQDFKNSLYGNTDIKTNNGSTVSTNTDSKVPLSKMLVDISNPSGGSGFYKCEVTRNPNDPVNLWDRINCRKTRISDTENGGYTYTDMGLVNFKLNNNHVVASGTPTWNGWIIELDINPTINAAKDDIFTLSYEGIFEGITYDGTDGHNIYGFKNATVLAHGTTPKGYYITVKLTAAMARLRLIGYAKTTIPVNIDAYFMLESGSTYHDVVPYNYNKTITYLNSVNFYGHANSSSSNVSIENNGNRFAFSGTPTASQLNLTSRFPMSLAAGTTYTLAIDHPQMFNIYINLLNSDNTQINPIIYAGSLAYTFTLEKDVTHMRIDTSGMTANTYYSADFSIYLIRHVYEGEIDMLSGKLIVNAYESGNLATPEIYYLEPHQIETNPDTTVFTANTGDILDCEYRPLVIPENSLIDSINNTYPVGSVYQSTTFYNPQNWMKNTVWEQIGTQTIGTETVYYFRRTY